MTYRLRNSATILMPIAFKKKEKKCVYFEMSKFDITMLLII